MSDTNEIGHGPSNELDRAAQLVCGHSHLVCLNNDLICLLDAQHVCVAVNQAFLNAFGKREAQIVGQGRTDPGGRETFAPLVDALLERGPAHQAESLQRWWDFPSWGFRYVKAELESLRDDRDTVVGVLVSVRDITDAKLAQNALEESERRFEDFADVTTEWYWELDSALRFVYLSERFEAVMGMSRDQALGRKRTELFPEEDYATPATRRHYRDLEQRHPFRGYQFTRIRPDGERRVIRLSGKPVSDEHGRFQGYRGVAQDASELHRMESRIAHLASHDPLTGLVNRQELENRLRRVLETARLDNSEHGLCYLDLDGFRIVNDHCGHSAGDELLERLGDVLRSKIRRRDTLARTGGDEFAILMEHCSQAQLERVADSVREAVAEFHYVWQDRTFDITASVGVVPISADTSSIDDVLSAADRACYAAKDRGGNRSHQPSEQRSEPAEEDVPVLGPEPRVPSPEY